MDENQQQTVLKSIAASTSLAMSPQDRQAAFQVLEEFKAYDGRIPVCIAWLHQERHVWETLDITVATKLLSLSILEAFLQKGYAGLSQENRLALRHAVLTAARQLAPQPNGNEQRILGNKLASLLAGLLVRDFPQRWTTFFQDVFCPTSMGGLWYEGEDSIHTMGVLMCLECLRLVTEDCTDSDFNAKISTSRRNDVLIGLNEVSSQFLPLFFGVLSHYSVLSQSKSTLHNMRMYLIQNQRTLAQMTQEEATMYQQELDRKKNAARLICECLITLERFCAAMPLEWMLGHKEQYDFAAAFLHLIREPASNIQIHATQCLEHLAQRKLELHAWRGFISQLPQAVGEANGLAQAEQEERQMSAAVGGEASPPEDALTAQLGFHRALSRMLALQISAHLSHITTDKKLLNGSGKEYDSMSKYLRLLVDMLHHPSGRIASEQVNMWIGLLRDPNSSKSSLLKPLAGELLTCYMDHIVRIRWEDVEEQRHPQSSLFAASWDDDEEYEMWMGDLRSKVSQLFKFLGNVEPAVSATLISTRVQTLLTRHGNGQPGDHLDPSNSQLTQHSEACIQFEALHQPLENVLNGMPSWALQDDKAQHRYDPNKAEKRTKIRLELSQMASSLVSWSPSYLWLKFRRAQLLDSLKSYWVHDPSTLLPAIESLFVYLSAPDEWGKPDETGISSETTGLRKKSGVALVSISKKVPKHLVPWITQLSEATSSLLASHQLLPMTEMHLYEFLTCVATAVEDPVARSNFVANVLANSLNTLESAELKESVSSVENFLAFLGIAQAATSPTSVTDLENVKAVTSRFSRMFSAINQLLSVGKRCHEAARKQKKNFLQLQDLPTGAEFSASNFPDEGPVSLQDLALSDPFAPLGPRVLPVLIQVIDMTLRLWHPEQQAVLLQNPIQRYALAISDDEAYLSQKHDNKNGGVFGEGGTAGSVVSGTDRRDQNLAPRWSGWLNELRNTCFQLLGLFAGERVLYAPEISGLFPRFVSVVVDPGHLGSMEHRHFAQFLKQFVEIVMLSCPVTLYSSHLAPILGPIIDHVKQRLEQSWAPVINPASFASFPDIGKALASDACVAAAAVAARGGEKWFASFYARSGLVVGDLDNVTSEAAVEKYRTEFSRIYSDMIQTALALKGDWALVLANQAKEEQAVKKGDPSKLTVGPRNRVSGEGRINADGTPREDNQYAVDARKSLRISALCHFLFLEDESLAGNLTLSVIQCLEYPDAYTCRRCTRICHRILETVAWSTRYTPLLANNMFLVATKNIVTEPKWLVGLEWDMINLLRDIYCRLVLGQVLQPGGQGPGQQQGKDPTHLTQFEQAKSADQPLQGGGILVVPSDLPRKILASLPGLDVPAVEQFEANMNRKRSAKDQKEFLRDLLRIAAENSHHLDGGRGGALFDRAVKEESLLNQKTGKFAVADIPEKLVTQSQLEKREKQKIPEGLGAYHLGVL